MSKYPEPWEARREGERAFESGRGNPYRERNYNDSYEDNRDREKAEDQFRWGRSAAEERAQEEAEQHRQAAIAQDEYEQEQQYEPPQQEEQDAQ